MMERTQTVCVSRPLMDVFVLMEAFNYIFLIVSQASFPLTRQQNLHSALLVLYLLLRPPAPGYILGLYSRIAVSSQLASFWAHTVHADSALFGRKLIGNYFHNLLWFKIKILLFVIISDCKPDVLGFWTVCWLKPSIWIHHLGLNYSSHHFPVFSHLIRLIN